MRALIRVKAKIACGFATRGGPASPAPVSGRGGYPALPTVTPARRSITFTTAEPSSFPYPAARAIW